MPFDTLPLDTGVTGQTIVARFRSRENGFYWNGSDPEAFDQDHWDDYQTLFVEEGTTGSYILTIPALPAGFWDILARLGSAVDSPGFDAEMIQWSGSAILNVPQLTVVTSSSGSSSAAASATFFLKKGDLAPSLSDTLAEAGVALDLTGATVTFKMRLNGASTGGISGSAVIVDAEAGLVRYDWALHNTDTVGFYVAEWEILLPGGIPMTVPGYGFRWVMVEPGLT